MVEQVGTEREKAKYNSMSFIHLRLNSLWTDAHNHSRAGQYEKWNMDLECIWVELVEDATEDELEKYEEIDEDLQKTGFKRELNALGEKKLINKGVLHKKIRKKAIFLKRLQKNQGKAMDYEESWDSYMD